MGILFVLLPASICLALLGFGAYYWMVRSGQLEDLDTPALRMLNDESDSSNS